MLKPREPQKVQLTPRAAVSGQSGQEAAAPVFEPKSGQPAKVPEPKGAQPPTVHGPPAEEPKAAPKQAAQEPKPVPAGKMAVKAVPPLNMPPPTQPPAKGQERPSSRTVSQGPRKKSFPAPKPELAADPGTPRKQQSLYRGVHQDDPRHPPRREEKGAEGKRKEDKRAKPVSAGRSKHHRVV